jgi:hypothetical protein
MSDADEYRQRALAAELKGLQTTDAGLREAYEHLAREWLQMSAHAKRLERGGKGTRPK